MTFEPSEIQTFMDLGLTSVQARVYLTLARFGPLKTTSISKQSKIARPDVYRILTKLHDLSLVEQMIETPVRFRAVPIDKGLQALLKKKTQDYEKLKKDSEALLVSVNLKENAKEIQAADSSFVLIPKKETLVKRQIEIVEETKKSIDLVLSWNRYYYGLEVFDPHYKRAIERKVFVRYILEDPTVKKLKEEAITTHECDSCKMRFIEGKPKAIFGIYDQKKLMLTVDPVSDTPGGCPSLWTDNQSLISLVQDSFDNLWRRARSEQTVLEKIE